MKIRTYIVDDEPLLLRSIKLSIESAHADFQVVGQATAAGTAIGEILTLQPDVVFVDIMMPVMNGIEMIQQLRAKACQAEYVILSGHREFEFAQQAIKLGVADYLVKPINPSALSAVLQEIADKCNAARKLEQHRLLEDLLNAGGEDRQDTGARKRVFDSGLKFVFCHICLGPFTLYFNNQFMPLYIFDSLLDSKKLAMASDGVATNSWLFNGRFANEKYALFTVPSHPDQLRLSDHLSAWLSERLEVPYTLVVSQVFEDPGELLKVKRMAAAELASRALFGQACTINLNHLDEASPPADGNFAENLKILQNLIKKNRHDEARQMIRQIIRICEDSNCTQMTLAGLLKKIFAQIFLDQLQMLSEPGIVDLIIVNSGNYASLARNVLQFYEDCYKPLSAINAEDTHSENIVAKTRQYIDENYTRHLSIQEMAEKFGYNYSYFCIIFKKHIGLSPNEYVIEKRINKAKSLLLASPDLSIRDIAAFIGYDDAYYFSRIFKAVAGVTPSAFRKTLV